MSEIPEKIKKYVETPLMKQYYDIKAVHHDAILLFRVGDFYETFGDDAIKAAGILGITLTRRANGAASSVELAGFPHHAIETYLPKLVRAGERVAICEQLEDPKTVKTLVKRGVTELVTPGVAFNDNILDHKENSFLACVFFGKKSMGVAFLDVSTGEFFVAEGSSQYIDKLIANFSPKEVLIQKGFEGEFRATFGRRIYTYRLDEWVFSEDRSRQKLQTLLGTTSLKGFGLENMAEGITAAGAILYYLDFTEHKNIAHITKISRVDEGDHVWLDKFTIRNLELFGSNAERGLSFVSVIDRTLSPMGSRLLKRWIGMPLKSPEKIEARLAIVDSLLASPALKDTISENIAQIGDLERIISKIAVGRVSPREIVQFKNSLYNIEKIKETIALSGDESLRAFGEKLDFCASVRERIEREILPDPAVAIVKGGVIADGVSHELDQLRKIALHGKDFLNEIVSREIDRTGISSLKISYNNVFGYYIEVRNAHKDKVPAEWIRKQTLVNAERYITEELKEYETKILGAEQNMLVIEQQLYAALLDELTRYVAVTQSNASVVAQLDCLVGFASLAASGGYCRPRVDDSDVIDITAGRHPVIEHALPIGESYVPNDVYLDGKQQQIMMITGPNMSGKSALLRQTALIVLMAQIGSYVPAAAASIGVVDKIFTRVGASDNISQGESTFMVEMLESANILNNISGRSLVLFDEIGRGTSTYDGISIAWAIVEYIHEHPRAKAKTLFATHYHELNEMEDLYPRVRNYNVSVKEANRSVVFLRKLERGGTEHSFGIHVAKMAGMPASLVERAESVLRDMEASRRHDAPQQAAAPVKGKKGGAAANNMQLSIFQLDDPVLKQVRDEIKELDINSLTPIEALNKLNHIKKLTGL